MNARGAGFSGVLIAGLGFFLIALSVTLDAADREKAQPSPVYVFDITNHRDMDFRWGQDRFLDLDTGAFVEEHPPGDLFASPLESDSRVRAGMNMVAIPVDDDRWESATPNEVRDRVSKAKSKPEIRLAGKTWFFKTQKGAVGMLQIFPHETRPGTVNVHFKRVRPQREFFPEVVTVLSPIGERRVFNLDEGRLVHAVSTNAAVAYLEKDAKRGWQLVVSNAHNYSTQKAAGLKMWEEWTAEKAAEPPGLAGLHFERTGFYEVTRGEFPKTILIPQWGLLQVSEFDEATGRVTLRYKRVAPAQ